MILDNLSFFTKYFLNFSSQNLLFFLRKTEWFWNGLNKFLLATCWNLNYHFAFTFFHSKFPQSKMHTLTNSFETFKCFSFSIIFSINSWRSVSKTFNQLPFSFFEKQKINHASNNITCNLRRDHWINEIFRSEITKYYERRLPGIYLISASFRKRIVDPIEKIRRSSNSNNRQFSKVLSLLKCAHLSDDENFCEWTRPYAGHTIQYRYTTHASPFEFRKLKGSCALHRECGVWWWANNKNKNESRKRNSKGILVS